MGLENELPDLAEEPHDARGAWAASGDEEPDECVYRLGLRALPVPGLPAEISVADVTVAFTPGPVRAQVTEMRQRHGLPVHFDKRMSRQLFGAGELVALLSLTATPLHTSTMR